MNTFTIEMKERVDDGLGGYIEEWTAVKTVEGYLDLLSGTDLNSAQNAITEESTHVLVIPSYTEGITDKMRVVDDDNRFYHITYADNPVGINHHNELYLTFGGVL